MSDTIQYLFFRDEFQFRFYKWEEGERFISGKNWQIKRRARETGRHDVKPAVPDGNGCLAVESRDVPHYRGESGLGLRSAHLIYVLWPQDSWNKLLIGDVELKRVRACSRWDTRAAAREGEEKGRAVCLSGVWYPVCVSRCILTTVDPDTGVISRKEPLETLKR